jgi:predicted transglutaminase-like protease
MKKILLYVAGTLTLLWGISHLFPTANVVRDFGDISFDNKMIITMEWIVEGMTLIFFGTLTIIVTMVDTKSRLSRTIYVSIAGMLFALSILSVFTGFRVNFLPFKLCPVIFSISAILILIGNHLKLKTEL